MIQLVDPFGREISYIRISVTDRCDFRDVYCMSEDMTFLPKRDIKEPETGTDVRFAELQTGISRFACRGDPSAPTPRMHRNCG